MAEHEDNQDDMDPTAEQLAALRELGVAEADLQDLTYSDAQEWIDELRAMRQDSGKVGRE